MPTVLYTNTILDPRSNSVDPIDDFFICKKINKKWHIIESHPTASRAHKAMQTLADHALIEAHVSDPNYYMVCKKGLFETRSSL